MMICIESLKTNQPNSQNAQWETSLGGGFNGLWFVGILILRITLFSDSLFQIKDASSLVAV